ncbi:hypothetical protein C8046_00635 [Serinibacter arcticus]|uniref:Uncharacterized protein n=1 Tax=Serinibacter arcticus TaxID=1655435 RepID=A0A2U1ZR14_9MICO|nr:hypothetical protein [Serinibacter arcticus]PWD49444.1 hypothetical protein C8046_00635 [Serinibacter arcticus]
MILEEPSGLVPVLAARAEVIVVAQRVMRQIATAIGATGSSIEASLEDRDGWNDDPPRTMRCEVVGRIDGPAVTAERLAATITRCGLHLTTVEPAEPDDPYGRITIMASAPGSSVTLRVFGFHPLEYIRLENPDHRYDVAVSSPWFLLSEDVESKYDVLIDYDVSLDSSP